jgi:hypothetical protein
MGPSTLSSSSATSTNAVTATVASAAGASERVQIEGLDSIKISQGSLTLASGHPGTLTLRGSHGFTFEGRTLSGVDPSLNCSGVNPCFPGQTVAFTGTWVGNDLPGTARLQGDTYTDVGGLNSPSSLRIDLTGSFVAPAQATTTTIEVPFSVGGLFVVSGVASADLEGRGTVTFTLAWNTALSGWMITSSSFDFGGGK